MLTIKNRGSGIFYSIASAASRILGKEAVKRAATQAIQRAATEAGKKLGEKAVQKVSSISRDKPIKRGLTPKSKDILNKYTAPKEDFNLNSLISGSTINKQDYVKSF